MPCEHGWPRDGWGCPFRKCLDDEARTRAAEYAEALRAEAEEASRTPEDKLVEALRGIWQNQPEQRDIVEALVQYAEARNDVATAHDNTRRCA